MSCCACLKIQVLTPIENVPAAMLEGGKVFLDTSREDELEFSRALSELSEIGNIKDEAALSIGLPYSEKNKRIADFVRNHNLVGNTRAPLAVLVQEGTTVHQLNYLTFTGSDDTAQKFEAQLERGPGHWLHDANRLLLKDIPFDDFELVFDKLYLNWQEEHKYDGQDSVGYYWPLVNYGAWLTKDTILPEDMRPWFHLLALLEKGFCEIGWKFRSSFFETEFGRRLICYLLAENLLEVPEILALKRFRATTQQSSVAFGPSGVGDVIFGTEVYDPGNNYNPATGVFTSTGVFNFSIGVEYTHNGPPGPVVIYIVREPLSGPEEVLAEFRVSTDAPQFFQTNTVALEAENIAIAVGDKISVRAVAFTELIVTGYFQGHAVKAYLDRGMIINPATLIAPELTLLDLLKAAIHLCNGRIETNWEDNEVWVYQPYKTDVFYEEGVEGFFTDAPAVSLSEIVLPDSELVTVERQDKKRYLVIGFADSNDEHVKQKNEGRNTPLYSKIIDRGAQYEEGREYNKNPLFEPTLNKELVKFPLVSPLIVPNNEVDIPHCLDNGNGELSFKIGYRILYCAGYRVQRADNNEIRRWRFQNFGLDNVPYAFQVPGSRLDVAGNGELPRQVLIYGERDIDDLYAMCYRRDLLGKLYSTRSSFQALLNAQEYRTMSFRSLYSLHYGGRTFTARLLEIAGRRTCTGAPAELILRPEAWGGDVCPGKEPPIMAYQRPPCPNYPEIDIAIDVTGNTIIATAQDTAINDPILSDVWVYSDDDGASWQEYTPGTPLSLPAVIFRRFLEFDAEAGTCEKVVTRSAVFETVCDNNPEITLNYDGSKNSITAVGAGAFNSPIASDTWTVEVDGGAPVAYTAGNEISGFTTVKFTRTVSFANNCEDVVAVAEHEVEGDQCNNLPTLDLVEVADCVYEPQVGGTTSSDICLTLIEVSWNAGGKWLPWDGHPVKGAPDTFIRASFMFCDSCPPIHIEKECPFE